MNYYFFPTFSTFSLLQVSKQHGKGSIHWYKYYLILAKQRADRKREQNRLWAERNRQRLRIEAEYERRQQEVEEGLLNQEVEPYFESPAVETRDQATQIMNITPSPISGYPPIQNLALFVPFYLCIPLPDRYWRRTGLWNSYFERSLVQEIHSTKWRSQNWEYGPQNAVNWLTVLYHDRVYLPASSFSSDLKFARIWARRHYPHLHSKADEYNSDCSEDPSIDGDMEAAYEQEEEERKKHSACRLATKTCAVNEPFPPMDNILLLVVVLFQIPLSQAAMFKNYEWSTNLAEEIERTINEQWSPSDWWKLGKENAIR